MASVPTGRLTKRAVDAFTCPQGKSQAILWCVEPPGFGLRVTAGGVKSYVVQGRVNGREKRITIGRHGPFTVEQARVQANELLRTMRLGTDPLQERAKAKAMDVSLKDVMQAYLKDRDLKETSRHDIKRHIDKSFAAWAEKPFATITRDMVKRRFAEMTKDGPSQANQAFRILRALLNYARAAYRTDEGPTLKENPVDVIGDAKLWNRTQPKTGRIPIDKVGAVWLKLEERRLDTSTKTDQVGSDYVAFLMLTGCRASEAAKLTWDRVRLDEESGTWHLPDPKNRRAVTFPLCAAAREILKTRLTKRPHGTKFVFNTWGKHGHITNVNDTLKYVAEVAGCHISRHDLRRTFRAIADKAGVSFEKTKLLMNHVASDVTLRHYTDTTNLHESCTDEAERIGAWIVRQGDIADTTALGANVVALRA